MSAGGALIISEDEFSSAELKTCLEQEHGFDVSLAGPCTSLERELNQGQTRVVFVDLRLERSHEEFPWIIEQLTAGRDRGLANVVAISDNGYSREWAAPIEQLVVGTLMLPLDRERLAKLLNGVPKNGRAAPLNGSANRRVLHGRTLEFVTDTPELISTLDDLAVAATHDVTVLLVGETGTGKTYLARLVHELSPRRDERFLTVACGALPPDLIESTLFGHVRGAFTGADRTTVGKFEAAGRGSLLLDEIDVLEPQQQAKLLRVIETGEFEPVGCNETRKSEARLIVASNLNLETMIASNRFRADLYYRLKVLEFHIPALRKRPLDIVPLALQFIESFCTRHAVSLWRIHPEFLEALKAYHWPGNVRELENLVRRAVLLCRNGELMQRDLPAAVLRSISLQSVPSATAPIASALMTKIALTEQETINQSLRANNYKRAATARALGISRVGLYKKMKKYGMLEPKIQRAPQAQHSTVNALGEAS